MEETARPERVHKISISEIQISELTNLAIEFNALTRIFDRAACCTEGPAHEEVRRAYRDISALMKPLCTRLEKWRSEVVQH